MSAQELSNMVFAIKDKITDKEFKDLMDKLSIKNQEDKKIIYISSILIILPLFLVISFKNCQFFGFYTNIL